MFQMMNEARVGVGFGAAVIGYRGYMHSLEYAKDRLQGRKPSEKNPEAPQVPIIEHADVRRMLLAQKAYSEGGLALCLYGARLMDDQHTHPDEQKRMEAGKLLDLLTPVIKAWPSEFGPKANDLAIQVYGGAGHIREYPVEPAPYTYLRAHVTPEHVVCRPLLEKKNRATLAPPYARPVVHSVPDSISVISSC